MRILLRNLLWLGALALAGHAYASEADADFLEFLGAEAGEEDEWYEFIEIALEGLPLDMEAPEDDAEVASND